MNLPIADLLDEDGVALLRPLELERIATEHGLTPDRTITTYCHLSDRGALAWVVLREVLGYPSVRVYDGGWWEYSHLLGVPVDADPDQPAGAPVPPAPEQRVDD